MENTTQPPSPSLPAPPPFKFFNPYWEGPERADRSSCVSVQTRISADAAYHLFRIILPDRGSQDALLSTVIDTLNKTIKQTPTIPQRYDRFNDQRVLELVERIYIDPRTGIDCRTGKRSALVGGDSTDRLQRSTTGPAAGHSVPSNDGSTAQGNDRTNKHSDAVPANAKGTARKRVGRASAAQP